MIYETFYLNEYFQVSIDKIPDFIVYKFSIPTDVGFLNLEEFLNTGWEVVITYPILVEGLVPVLMKHLEIINFDGTYFNFNFTPNSLNSEVN